MLPRERREEELARLAAEGVQSLLLEGGPTLASAFLELDLVDKLLVFVAPTLTGTGLPWLGQLGAPSQVQRLGVEPIGPDLLLSGYLHEP